jgi:AraC family transcriptional regulator, regulatory protein of adaptative response / methylated-DNA-[protein]-cysteine methyltransferase
MGGHEVEPEACWAAIRDRNATLDGKFFYGVVTTGVYCRPSCPSRRPLRRNVRFFPSSEAAERAGLRPCLRCGPGANTAAKAIGELCDYIREHSVEPVDLKRLAARAGFSLFHLQRTFKTVTGVSPREFLESCRIERLKSGLRGGQPVTTAVYDAGFSSGSRVYERAGASFGMTPGQYGRGGFGVKISYAFTQTRFGLLMIAATDRGICSVQFGSDEEAMVSSLRERFPNASTEAARRPLPESFDLWMDALAQHLEVGEPLAELPLDVQATAFQIRVWKFLQGIPSGEVRSYTEVAQGIGKPGAARAVARACATNPVAILVPCHRVIRGSGALGGYRWGLDRKRRLLESERTRTPTPSNAT